MMDLSVFQCHAYFQEDGTMVIEAQINSLTPKLINELDLRQRIVSAIGNAYLEHFNKYSKDPEANEELDFLLHIFQNAQEFTNKMRNPKSTENDHEII